MIKIINIIGIGIVIGILILYKSFLIFRSSVSIQVDDNTNGFDDIGGYEKQLDRIKEMIEIRMENDEQGGILLYGRQGSGKHKNKTLIC